MLFLLLIQLGVQQIAGENMLKEALFRAFLIVTVLLLIASFVAFFFDSGKITWRHTRKSLRVSLYYFIGSLISLWVSLTINDPTSIFEYLVILGIVGFIGVCAIYLLPYIFSRSK